ncbi:MAG: metabolite traffic protein EboE [Chromatiaceae bacterium]|nr:metabolite traffic protein EboE [Hydrogenophilales bacterium]MBP6582198.1 metabolite traffic protein EboE [Chromatiaceae bacterium]MBP8283005.1 metabolite traffic protein EboE [Chromatiaceae bacterium]
MITYCTNIHPGESWGEVFAALRQHIPVVKAAFSPDAAFPIGLRLAERAARELDAARNREFTDWLRANDCFVPTLNGFPYGAFHGGRVKENVYLPDWRAPERAAYTLRLTDLLAGWLPEGMAGSISSVPLGFKGVVGWDDLPAFRVQLESVLRHLAEIHDRQGRKILLALEPEPGCLLETTDEACRFFAELDLSEELTAFLGLCYDACHQAVEFEDPADSLRRLDQAGIPIAKVQVSSALRVAGEGREHLRRFDEPCYLHQVVVRNRDGNLDRYADLGQALAREEIGGGVGEEWRCHFHVPIFLAGTPDHGTTQSFLIDLLPLLPADILLEVETYTWDVLPPELRLDSVTDSIVRELEWLAAIRGTSLSLPASPVCGGGEHLLPAGGEHTEGHQGRGWEGSGLSFVTPGKGQRRA